MENLKKILLTELLIITSLCLFLILLLPKSSPSMLHFSSAPIIPITHPKSLYDSAFENAKEVILQKEKVFAAVFPHHLLAKDLIAETFVKISGQKPKTVILLAPNHKNIGKENIQTTDITFKTPYGNLEPDKNLIKNLKLAKDNETFGYEHSIVDTVSFIKKTFPEALFVPIIFKSYTGNEQVKNLAYQLATSLQQGDLVLATIDFSHEENNQISKQQDEETLKAIKEFLELGDFSKINELGDNFLDSKPALLALLLASKQADAKNFNLLDQSTSFEVSSVDENSVTSYITFYLTETRNQPTITLITTGDIIPARNVNWKMTMNNDFTLPFQKVADFLKEADLTLINLEAPLVQNCPVTTEGMIFCGNQKFVEGLKLADIDMVNLANNHALNYGATGMQQTVQLLSENKILFSGVDQSCKENVEVCINNGNQLAIKEIKGIKFGFLGFNLLEPFEEEKILAQIKKAKEKVDILVVSCHWGAEYLHYPAQETIKLAYKMIEAGSDLIAGNHPHAIQPVETYKDKLIIYAHGNFIFDQEWSQQTKTGIVSKITFSGTKIVNSQFFPVFISNYCCPEFLEGEKTDETLKLLKM